MLLQQADGILVPRDVFAFFSFGDGTFDSFETEERRGAADAKQTIIAGPTWGKSSVDVEVSEPHKLTDVVRNVGV